MPQDSPSRRQNQFMLRMPDGMRDEIAGLAKKSGRSMNSEIVFRLQQSINDSRMINEGESVAALGALETAYKALRILSKHPNIVQRLFAKVKQDEEFDDNGE